MKKIFYTLCSVALVATSLLGTSACSEQEWVDEAGLDLGSAPGTVSFSLQHVASAIAPDESRTRVFIADRSLDNESASEGGLYCAPGHRFWLNGPSFQATGLRLQWYKFSFVQVPHQITGTDATTQKPITINSDQLFSDLYSQATEAEKNTRDFSKLLVDYSSVLRLQEKDYHSSTRHDLNIYRGVVNRWTTRPEESIQPTTQEKVSMKAITGELHLNMGILPDQFEHPVSQIVITASIPKRVYISDHSVSDTESQVVVENNTTEERSYTYNVPAEFSQPQATQPCKLKMVLLPCVLEGHITVRFQNPNVPAQTFTIRAQGDIPTVKIRSGVRTHLLFNGMFKKEFEVRYAGFADSEIGVAPDEWNGGWEALPARSYVVDYSLSEGQATRAAISEKVPASQRIRSLHYFLYDIDGMLVKARRIPDINEQTQWPLKRATMTWGQREALKDTLSAEGTYTAFFVANIDKDVIGLPQDGIVGQDLLSNAKLVLPPNGYTDFNQPYLWKGTIKYERPAGSTGQEDTRQHPLSKQITLRRILSRMEVNRVAVTDALLDQALKANPAYKKLLEDELKTVMKDMVVQVNSKLKELYTPNCNKLRDILIENTNVNAVSTQKEQDYHTALRTQVKAGADYQTRTMDWNLFAASSLRMNGALNRFSFDLLKGQCDAATQAPASAFYDLKNGTAMWIGLADAETTDTKGNMLQGISFYQNTASGALEKTPKLALTFKEPLQVRIPKNEIRRYACNPVASISSSVPTAGNFAATTTLNVNMELVYGSIDALVSRPAFVYDNTVSMVTKEEFMKAITDVVNLRGGWNALQMTIHIPASNEYQFTTSIAESK